MLYLLYTLFYDFSMIIFREKKTPKIFSKFLYLFNISLVHLLTFRQNYSEKYYSKKNYLRIFHLKF